MAPRPRVFTIPASAPFLATLVKAILDGRLTASPADGDPLALADATLFLPTRRACRLARDAFVEALDGKPAVLPRILAIGDVDEDEFVFADGAVGAIAAEVLALPAAMAPLERRVLLARLVQEWARAPAVQRSDAASLVVANPAAAFALAVELERLIDDFLTREVPWDRLDTLVPDRFDGYWALTLDFLKIARSAWPDILAERGAMEPAARRTRFIEAEAERLSAHRAGPVIAAGSTGSIPATAKLLATIARSPYGAVVLPGLDSDLDDASWELLAEPAKEERPSEALAVGHPQFAMHGLLRRIGIARKEVVRLAEPAAHGREFLVSEALRPAATTELWRAQREDGRFRARLAPALDGMAAIEAANAEEEALAIAVALREILDDPLRTAALVTPDRALARRVVAALARWNVPVDDSGGLPLADTTAGRFARLAAEVALGGLPVPLLALLRHPLLRLGASADSWLNAVAVLEQGVLRGPRPRPGSAGLAHALGSFRREQASLHPSDPRRGLSETAIASAARLIEQLAAALAPLEGLQADAATLTALAAAHREILLSLGTDQAGATPLFAGDDGTALAAAFDDVTALRQADIEIASHDYPNLFAAVLAGRIVRGAPPPDTRVRIFGLLEARLQTADRVVLGGLVEGAWPPQPSGDPWLSRPMRQELGLDLPERRIGLSAHDLAQSLGAREVIVSSALKREGAPTVPSRLLQRLAAVAGEEPWREVRSRGARYVQLARLLDRPTEPPAPIARPEPRPPRAMRPAALAVTDIENWVRDPYTIYAKHILKLRPLDPIDAAPGATDRGTLIHNAVGDFVKKFASALPAAPLEELIEIGRGHFARLEDYPEARAFWWPRFLRIACWFVGWEAERRTQIAESFAEIRGKIDIPAGERTFQLSARADRIDRLADGRYAILDYKTGAKRSEKQIRLGLAPQLTLEGAILRHGGFPGVPSGASLAEIAYVLLKGGSPAGEHSVVKFKESDPDGQADKALAGLTEMVLRFERDDMPYRALVMPVWAARYGEFDHLARVQEWSAVGGGDGDGGET